MFPVNIHNKYPIIIPTVLPAIIYYTLPVHNVLPVIINNTRPATSYSALPDTVSNTLILHSIQYLIDAVLINFSYGHKERI